MSEILDVLLDVVKDSLITFAIILIINIIVSFFENKLSNKINKSNKLSPLIGAGIGLIPQCGFSVVASDLYLKRRISMGTVIAVFIACSDEALPIMLANPSKVIMILPLLLIKLVVGFIVGFSFDMIFSSKIEKMQAKTLSLRPSKPQKISFSSQVQPDTCCTKNSIDFKKTDTKKENFNLHFVKPLLHSLKILAYVFGINLVLSFIIYFIGEDTISSFLITNKFVTPIISVLIGLIPNCASSIILTELYVSNAITFSASVAGLICNAGLGLIFILKDKKRWKEGLIIIGSVIIVGLVVGYLSLLIECFL